MEIPAAQQTGAGPEHRVRGAAPHGLAAVPIGDTLSSIAGRTARGVVVPRFDHGASAAGTVFRGASQFLPACYQPSPLVPEKR
jgi:hypothetical protein